MSVDLRKLLGVSEIEWTGPQMTVAKSWRKRIADAHPDQSEHRDNITAAGDWATCAVGEVLGLHGSVKNPEVADKYMRRHFPILHRLGLEFFNHILVHEYHEASKILMKIETYPYLSQVSRRRAMGHRYAVPWESLIYWFRHLRLGR